MSQKKLRKTLVFSQKNSDIYDKIEEMSEQNINISEYICNLVREDLNKNSVDSNLNDIQIKLDLILKKLDSKTFITDNTELIKEELTEISIVKAKDIISDDIDEMLGI